MKERRAALIKQLVTLASKTPIHWKYYLTGLFLIAVGFVIICQITLIGFLLGIPILGLGCFLCFLSSKLDPRSLQNSLVKKSHNDRQRNINTDGGNYNEHISGDYINIQGNQIYVGQDLSHFTAQIQEVLEHLRAQDYSKERAEKQVIQELTTELHQNLRFRQKLFGWKDSLGSSTTHAEEVAERLVQIADEIPKGTENDSFLVIEDKYKLLHDLLEAGQWKEADEETARFIHDLMPETWYSERTIAVNEIPPGDLKTINKLWLRYSKGRFGFSVQQRIWKRISSAYPPQKRDWKNEDAYTAFIDCVGWSFENGYLYYTDLQYSLAAPAGHLPAIVMFEDADEPYFYYSSPNYCHLNQTVFDDLMERQYERNSFIPSWLRY
ncbi:GUN4 domain-containing protein [Trichocoleus desertorum AS-A10]|uniref:GUN4 domain-containing protein n=1 Tax=Trichocoleus desertorum TaxID=1481672 RepID=UPI0032997418